VECIATGLLAGMALAHRARQEAFTPPPRTMALGSLVHYVTHASPRNYQPANIAFDLLPPMEGLPREVARDRRARREKQCERALQDLQLWLEGCREAMSVAGKRWDGLARSVAPATNENSDGIVSS
jgi:methylenetetrahydrofolate--tRNA-(uracil-5-)-methyltransferase